MSAGKAEGGWSPPKADPSRPLFIPRLAGWVTASCMHACRPPDDSSFKGIGRHQQARLDRVILYTFYSYIYILGGQYGETKAIWLLCLLNP